MHVSALSQSGELDFRAVAEAMPQLVWVASADGTIEYFNSRWIEYTGVPLDSMSREGPKGVVHPEDLDETWERWSAALASGEPYEIEYRLRNAADGAYRWFVARAMPVHDEQGRLIRWIGSATDIDAQKRASANLDFVTDAAEALASLTDVDDIARALASIAVPRVADWCFVVLRGENGAYQTAAIAHRDAAMIDFAERYRDRYPVQPGSVLDIAIRKNTPILTPIIRDEDLQAGAQDEEHLQMMRRLQMHSSMIVPLSAGAESGSHFGALCLISAESSRTFGQDDLDVAQRVARRAAAAIESVSALSHERLRSQRLRFLSRASELAFQSLELRAGFDSLVEFIVSEMADLAYICLFESDGGLRTVASAHRAEARRPIANRLRGQRTLKPASEELAIRVLSQHRTMLFNDIDAETIASHMWDYLAPDVRKLDPHSGITVPLYARGETYGGLMVYWCESSRSYTEADALIFEDLGRRISMAIEHVNAFERERRIAGALQEALLPSENVFPRAADLSFDAYYRPSMNEAQVGGDWFDAFPRADGSIVVCVGDVTGRGLQAAGLMGKLRQAIGVTAMYEDDPAGILDAVDRYLRSRRAEAMATAFIGIIEPGHRRIRFANAGHPAPLLRSRTGIRELRADGLPLGLRDYGSAPGDEIALDDAELLVLYTDGLIEGTRDLAFGEKRLRDVLASDAVLHVRNPSRLLCDACLPLDSQDDTAVISVRFGERPSWHFDAENALSANETRRGFIDSLRVYTNDRMALEAAEVIFGELIGNVVRHAPGPIDVELDSKHGHPELHVIDRGRGFVRDPSLPSDPLSESGRGLYIIQELARALRVERIAGYGNHIAVTLRA